MKYRFIRILVALIGMVLLNACGGGGGGSNHAPIATDQTVPTAEDTAKAITLGGTDAEGDSLTYTIVSNPTRGTLSGTAPRLTYTPETNFNGSDSFTFTVNDGTVDSRIGTVNISVTAVNDAPTASDFSLTLDVDKSFVTADWMALSSAVDTERDALSASVSDGTHGTCMIFEMMDGSTNLLYLPSFDAPIEDHVDHCALTITDTQGAETTIDVGIDILYWKQLSSKKDFTIALKSDGTVWGWGSNRYGQLGDGTTIDRDHPVQESTHATDWTQVAAGYYHTVAIKSGGTLWSWGRNYSGQLGNHSNIDSVSPVQESTQNTHWIKAVAGSNFTVAKTSGETLYAWGTNRFGQLGIDAADDHRNEPTPVDGGSSGWSDIATGNNHVIALKTNGEIWSWGNNYHGQLGNNESRNSHPAPVRVATTDSDWKSIGCGDTFSFAIKNNGTLYAWGYNYKAQLGLGDTSDRKTPEQVGIDTWSNVSGGQYHSLGVKSNGSLWVWGTNYYSQLGDDDTIFRESEPYQVGTENDWSKVTASGTTSIAINRSGTLYGWGYNKFGQLGNKKTDTQYTPLHTLSDKTWRQISAGERHTLAIDQDRKLWAWGENDFGELGIGSNNSKPIADPESVTTSTWKSVATGSYFSVGIKTDGTLWTWGSNQYGLLGLGDNSIHSKNTPQQVGSSTWKSICVGKDYVAAIRSDDKLFTWGHNADGQLGIGNTTDQNQPIQEATHGSWRQISCGDYHMAGIRTNHGLWTWGKNSGGSLGLGDTDPHNEPQQITGAWVMVAAGGEHTLAIKSGDTLWGWGNNYYGQVGNGAYSQVTSPVQIGTDADWGIIVAGKDTSMAIRMEASGGDTVWVWGDNASGQFGLEGREVQKANQPQEIASLRGTTATTNVSLSVSPYSIGLVKNDGTLWAWGTNDHKRLARDWYIKTPSELIERHAP